MEDEKRRAFITKLLTGATALAVKPMESESKDLSDGNMNLAELNPEREYLLFVDPRYVDTDLLRDSLIVPEGHPMFQAGQPLTLAMITVIPAMPPEGKALSDVISLYSLDKKSA
jgi:hypothetical protein